MAEYIEREALVSDLEFLARYQDGFRQGVILGVVHTIKCAPAADVAAVVHGTWKRTKAYCTQYVCSECGDMWPDFRSNYCPNCGAKMKDGDGNG